MISDSKNAEINLARIKKRPGLLRSQQAATNGQRKFHRKSLNSLLYSASVGAFE